MIRLVFAASLLAAPMALAQSASPPVQPMPPNQAPAVARAQANAPARQAPTARILGVPVTADAPVSPAYDGTAFKTLGGQAETGEDAIAGQVMQPPR